LPIAKSGRFGEIFELRVELNLLDG
jgi:hypothetical protein